MAYKKGVKKSEMETRYQCKAGNDHLDRERIKGHYRSVSGTESTCSHYTESVINGIECRHPRQAEGYVCKEGDTEIDG